MNAAKRKDRKYERVAYLKLGGGGQDPRNEVVGVDDEARGGRDGACREGGDVAVSGGGGSVASGSQREGGEDGGDHASGGEHLWDVMIKIRRTTKEGSGRGRREERKAD